MNGQKNKQNTQKQFHFESNKKFESFDSFRLSKNDQQMLSAINNSQQETKKIQAIINGTIKRYKKSLYKGQKYYAEDLQFILDNFPSRAPSLMKSHNIVLNESQSNVNVKCHNCGNFTDVWRFCFICEDIHYCQEECQAKIRLIHEKQQCKLKPFPQLYKPLQVQIHIGSDLGKNIHFCFQHQVSMSLLMRGEKLLDQLMSFLSTSEGNIVLNDYQAKFQHNMIKFQKEIVSQKVEESKDQLRLQNFDEIVKLYSENNTLKGLQIFLLQNGAILWKKIREIHDNYFREIYIFRYP